MLQHIFKNLKAFSITFKTPLLVVGVVTFVFITGYIYVHYGVTVNSNSFRGDNINEMYPRHFTTNPKKGIGITNIPSEAFDVFKKSSGATKGVTFSDSNSVTEGSKMPSPSVKSKIELKLDLGTDFFKKVTCEEPKINDGSYAPRGGETRVVIEDERAEPKGVIGYEKPFVPELFNKLYWDKEYVTIKEDETFKDYDKRRKGYTVAPRPPKVD